jgi:hypothetical protein
MKCGSTQSGISCETAVTSRIGDTPRASLSTLTFHSTCMHALGSGLGCILSPGPVISHTPGAGSSNRFTLIRKVRQSSIVTVHDASSNPDPTPCFGDVFLLTERRHHEKCPKYVKLQNGGKYFLSLVQIKDLS